MISKENEILWKEYSVSKFPNEAVGGIKDNIFIPINNVSKKPNISFIIDPLEYLEIDPDILLHSHSIDHTKRHSDTDYRTPSYNDYKNQISTNIPWGISSCDEYESSDLIYFPHDRNTPLLDRDFIFYITDCWTLVQDWYYQNKNITLDYPDVDWWNDGKGIPDNVYLDWAERLGFHTIPLDELEVGDVVVMSTDKLYDHGGVYLGDGMILQHFVNRRSTKYSMKRLESFVNIGLRYEYITPNG